MTNYVRWSDICTDHVDRAGGERTLEDGKRELLATVVGHRLAEVRRTSLLITSKDLPVLVRRIERVGTSAGGKRALSGTRSTSRHSQTRSAHTRTVSAGARRNTHAPSATSAEPKMSRNHQSGHSEMPSRERTLASSLPEHKIHPVTSCGD
jgi:hypothetical protein